MTLRAARPEDGEALAALWVAAWAAVFPAIDFGTRVGWLRGVLAGAEVRVAVDAADVPLGFLTLDRVTGVVEQLAVAPGAQGRGVARALLAWARRAGPGWLELVVNAGNVRAVAFYARAGFVVTGRGVNAASGLPTLALRWERSGGFEGEAVG